MPYGWGFEPCRISSTSGGLEAKASFASGLCEQVPIITPDTKALVPFPDWRYLEQIIAYFFLGKVSSVQDSTGTGHTDLHVELFWILTYLILSLADLIWILSR